MYDDLVGRLCFITFHLGGLTVEVKKYIKNNSNDCRVSVLDICNKMLTNQNEIMELLNKCIE